MSNTLKFGNGEWYGKEGTILAYNSENNNYKPLPFDFSRASSATRVNKDGLIETVGADQPRVDYLNDSKGALLLEPSRSNLVLSSEDISGAGWGRSGWTLTDGFISPDGTNNAFSILRTTGVSFATTLSLSANTTYTYSVYIKNVDATNIQLRVQNSAGNSSGTESNCIVFQVTDQTNTDDFVRITHTFNTGDAGSYGIFLGYYSAGEYIAWGAQLEQGSYETSIIKTQGSIVTRLADSCSQTVPDGVIGQTEGTVYFESEINGLQGGDMRFQLSDGSTNNWFFMSSGEATGIGVKARAYINNGNVNQFNAYSEYLSAGKHKYALAYNQNDIAFYVDGVQVSLDTSATIPSCDEITLSGSTPTNVNVSHFLSYKDIKLYKTRLSNSELQTLTQV